MSNLRFSEVPLVIVLLYTYLDKNIINAGSIDEIDFLLKLIHTQFCGNQHIILIITKGI